MPERASRPADALEEAVVAVQPRSLWVDGFRRLIGNRMAMASLILIIALALMAFLAPVIAPYDPTFQDYSIVQTSPSWGHPFGTDALGREQLDEPMLGLRVHETGRFEQQPRCRDSRQNL